MQAVNLAEEVADTVLAPSGDLPLANLRVLVVDDKLGSRELVAFVLEQAGAEVVAVDSAIAALQMLQSLHFNILLGDQQQAIAVGFHTHLSKPVEPTDLITIVAHMCGRNG